MKKTTAFFRGKLLSFLFLFISLFFITNSGNSQPTSHTYNSAGNYTYNVPVGYSAAVTIEAWGAGGGGGNNSPGAKGGGGGGAYASLTTTLSAGNYSVTVGTGGAPTVNGGNSNFTTIVIAAGGTASSGTNPGAGGTTAASTGSTLFAGGTGDAASGNNGGGGAGSATEHANGGNASGNAGGNGKGNGGGGGNGINNPGSNGASPGAGGGGKAGPGNSSNSGSGADGMVIVTVNNPLPVKLSSIRAFEKQNGIQIEWTAYSEENLSKYQIERSSNGVAFTVIGVVIARISLSESRYSFFDAAALQGVNFYRLKSIDMDGRSGFSNIVKINLDKNVRDISVYPNPVTGNYFSFQGADLTKGNYAVKLFNNAGVQIFVQTIFHGGGAISQTLKLPGSTSSGIYSLQLINDGVNVMSKTIMVQK